jgi:hypothetical protein
MEGSYQCGTNSATFDATDESLCYLSGLYLDPNPNGLISYYTIIDRILFRLLQFLKRIGQCTGDDMRFEFIDDVNDHYHYNQFSAVTLTDNELVDLTANVDHLNVLTDFVNKRNFGLTIVNNADEPLVLSGPIRKIFGKQIGVEDYGITLDTVSKFFSMNFFGPLYYTIESNLVNSHINNVSTQAVSTNTLLRVIPFENRKPGILSVFERMNDGGCLQVDDPTIDLVTLSFRDHQGDYLLSLAQFVVTFVLDYVLIPKQEKPEFFSLDKIRRATADKVRDQLTKKLRTG